MMKKRKNNARGAFKWGKFSPKSLDAIKNSDAFINIFHGSVRSSKTISANIAFINHLIQSEHDEFLIIGKTERTVYRNVIKDLQKIVFPRPAIYNRIDAELSILGKTVYIIGAKDLASVDKIKGLTVAGLYLDEVSTLPKNAVEMAISRASLSGAKIWMTTNPDAPQHYIYKDYITNEALIADGTVKEFHFQLSDNPNLPDNYIKSLKKIYSGVFYDRNVLGKWVIAEGAIYDQFREYIHVFVNKPFDEYDTYTVSMDYGTSTACVFGFFGIKSVEGIKHYHLLKEYYHDAEKDGQLSDTQYADIMISFLGKHQQALIYCSHDATSLKTELRNRGLNVTSYKPNVLNDIKTIQSLLDEQRFKISETCEKTIEQMQSYVWDEKARKQGIEKPKKVDDHAVDMIRSSICANISFNNYSVSEKRYKKF